MERIVIKEMSRNEIKMHYSKFPVCPMREELSSTIPDWTSGPSLSKTTYPRKENSKD